MCRASGYTERCGLCGVLDTSCRKLDSSAAKREAVQAPGRCSGPARSPAGSFRTGRRASRRAPGRRQEFELGRRAKIELELGRRAGAGAGPRCGIRSTGQNMKGDWTGCASFRSTGPCVVALPRRYQGSHGSQAAVKAAKAVKCQHAHLQAGLQPAPRSRRWP